MSAEIIEDYDDFECEEDYYDAIADEIYYEVYRVAEKYQSLSIEELEDFVSEYGEDFVKEYCDKESVF